jgi:hypothetical protein
MLLDPQRKRATMRSNKLQDLPDDQGRDAKAAQRALELRRFLSMVTRALTALHDSDRVTYVRAARDVTAILNIALNDAADTAPSVLVLDLGSE